MSPRITRVPSAVVELLRLCVVVFFAGLGYEVASAVGSPEKTVLGPFNALWVGIILGSALGYVLGGVLGRGTVHVVSRTEQALRSTPAERIVAGAVGAVIGMLVAAGVVWPIFLVAQPALTVPVFGFVLVTLGLLGYRVGSAKRDAVLGMFGQRIGVTPPAPAASTLPRIVDTSVAIDGRIVDVVRAGFLHGTMLVPSPVLGELQGLADAGDELRRARGRRGLEVLETLRGEAGVEIEVLDENVPAVPEVDAKLVRLCLDRGAALLTLDTNLARSAALAGVRVLNLHALALALRPPVSAGDEVAVLLLKPGREQGQAVGYLDDGTMVVVEHARDRIGHDATVSVTSVLTTANGRMVFARVAGSGAHAPGEHP